MAYRSIHVQLSAGETCRLPCLHTPPAVLTVRGATGLRMSAPWGKEVRYSVHLVGEFKRPTRYVSGPAFLWPLHPDKPPRPHLVSHFTGSPQSVASPAMRIPHRPQCRCGAGLPPRQGQLDRPRGEPRSRGLPMHDQPRNGSSDRSQRRTWVSEMRSGLLT